MEQNQIDQTINPNDVPGFEQIFAIIPLVGWIMAAVNKKKYPNKSKRYNQIANTMFLFGLIYRFTR